MRKRSCCLRRAVTNRIKQSQVHSPNTRQHQRITLVTLALMLINRSHLARIGHHYPPAKCFQKSTDPWTMRSRLHHPERTVITPGQLPQRDSIVADAVLLDYFSPLIQRTKPVPAISQIQSYRNVAALGLLLHRRRAYLSAIAQTLFAFSSNLVRALRCDLATIQRLQSGTSQQRQSSRILAAFASTWAACGLLYRAD